jgi:phosphoglycolate phosphatase
MPLPSTDFHAAIVDLDGTLVDTLGDFAAAINRMLAGQGLPAVDAAFIERTIGRGGEHLVRRTLAQVGAPETMFDTAWAQYQHHYGEVNGAHSTVYAGAFEGLAALRAAGWPLACVTNKPTRHAAALLRAKGLAGHFDHVFGADAFARKKPDPLPLLEACRAMGSEPARTLMIGDSRNDAAAARAAGCPVVLLAHGYNHGEPLAAAGADAVLERLDHLPALLALCTIERDG